MKNLKLSLRFFGPYIGAGVKVEEISKDWKYMRVIMKHRFYNNNVFGTHFGGSLYSMVDPHFVLMLLKILGNGYIVWDKAASIDFIKPGKGTMTAEFNISDQVIEEIKTKTAQGEKFLPEFEVNVVNSDGEIVAKVHKTLYIRHKNKR
jgi:acyl-coenzyme A thioesterase PaaI-like protein